ncbi:MAG: rod-binding protein [Planctomycetota bacterium]|jgi:Rod binding domain-containing protein
MNIIDSVGIRTNAALEPKLDVRGEAKKIADNFETLFVQSMVEGMRKSGDMGQGEGLFGDGPGADTYTQWFDNFMSSHLAENGNIGLSDTLMEEFERLGQIPAEDDAQKEAKES